jgi:glutathione synthase/RimK-type ligase-like ATP-grasp enzyme
VLSPGINPDDANLAESLRARGIEPRAALWSDPQVDWAGFDAVLIRSTWDYFQHYEAFLRWLDGLERLGVPTINPTPLLRWNSNKRYLLELAPRGVAIIPTQIARAAGLPELLAEPGRHMVVKPTVSGTSWHTVRGTTGTPEFDEAVAALPAGLEYLVQPFMPEIEREGEWSLLFFGGAYSHAVLKRPAVNDYRVQSEFGGRSEAVRPGPELIASAQKVLSAVSELGYDGGLYARIDGVRSADRFLVMEVEMVEPFLFLSHDPRASRRFADVVAMHPALME